MSCCYGDRERAEEVLQEVYLRVLSNRARFSGRSSFRTWLFGVIRNVSREFSRSHGSPAELLAEPGAQSTSWNSLDSVGQLRHALRSLSERQREVIHLTFYEGCTVEQAASIMGVGVGSARQHYARGKNALRESLRQTGTSDES